MICLQDERYNIISHIGFFCLLISYFIRNPFYLRLCLSASSIILVAWGLLALPERSCYSTLIWNTLFFIINIVISYFEYKKLKSDNDS